MARQRHGGAAPRTWGHAMSDASGRVSSLPLADELAGVFARMSGLLLSEETVETSLGCSAPWRRRPCRLLRGAGVSIIDGRRRRSSGSTDARVRQADSLQYELRRGPVPGRGDRPRARPRSTTSPADPRWPRWTAAAPTSASGP